LSFTDVCLELNRSGGFSRYAEANDLEVETYGYTGRHAKSTLNVELRQPKTDYVTVRNVSRTQIEELRRFGRVLRGYPMRMRDFYRQAELRTPVNEKPVCPICKTDRHVHWIGRDHWTCRANHWPQHFGMLRLT